MPPKRSGGGAAVAAAPPPPPPPSSQYLDVNSFFPNYLASLGGNLGDLPLDLLDELDPLLEDDDAAGASGGRGGGGGGGGRMDTSSEQRSADFAFHAGPSGATGDDSEVRESGGRRGARPTGRSVGLFAAPGPTRNPRSREPGKAGFFLAAACAARPVRQEAHDAE